MKTRSEQERRDDLARKNSRRKSKKRAPKKRVHNKLKLQYSTPPTLSEAETTSVDQMLNSPEMADMLDQTDVPSLRIEVTPPNRSPEREPHKHLPEERSLFNQDNLPTGWGHSNQGNSTGKTSGSPFRNAEAADLFIPVELQDPIKLPDLPGFNAMVDQENKIPDHNQGQELPQALTRYWTG